NTAGITPAVDYFVYTFALNHHYFLKTTKILHNRHSRSGGNPVALLHNQVFLIPVFTGMTKK
ncbi:hypothetical protein COZ22_03295, partial [bacterium (Candidatus Howlettbacteria) CG_4_10_14_3_um_filter_37_10]